MTDVESFIAFADGLEASGAPGMADYARRGRALARDLEQARRELADERSARRALQESRDRLLALLVAQGVDREQLILLDEPGPSDGVEL